MERWKSSHAEQVAQLSIGTTTQQEVRNQLGKPKEKTISFEKGHEYTMWIYYLIQFASDPQTGVPSIRVTQIPISRAHRDTTEVAISFDQDGVVTDIQKYMPSRNDCWTRVKTKLILLNGKPQNSN